MRRKELSGVIQAVPTLSSSGEPSRFSDRLMPEGLGMEGLLVRMFQKLPDNALEVEWESCSPLDFLSHGTEAILGAEWPRLSSDFLELSLHV